MDLQKDIETLWRKRIENGGEPTVGQLSYDFSRAIISLWLKGGERVELIFDFASLNIETQKELVESLTTRGIEFEVADDFYHEVIWETDGIRYHACFTKDGNRSSYKAESDHVRKIRSFKRFSDLPNSSWKSIMGMMAASKSDRPRETPWFSSGKYSYDFRVVRIEYHRTFYEKFDNETFSVRIGGKEVDSSNFKEQIRMGRLLSS
jgi:hypothetical protein